MTKRLLTLLFLAVSALAYGQTNNQALLNETNFWYFGTNAGIRFFNPDSAVNGVPARINPTTLDDAQNLDAREGTSAISDQQGRLQFYVGTGAGFGGQSSVFNRNHQVMPNGDDVIGGSSSSQNAICVRRPGSLTDYYIFHVAQLENYGTPTGVGFYYSKVDMTLNGGLGDVVDSLKNQLIMDSATEKVTAVLHRNRRWVWVVSHKIFSDAFCAVLVTEDGPQWQTPIYSNTGLVHRFNRTSEDENVARGCMKLSPNGNRIGVAITGNFTNGRHYMQVARFNNETGEVFDPFSIETNNATGFGPYGVEFSPDNSKVYFGDRQRNRVTELDLCAGSGDSLDVVTSRREINTSFEPGCLQLALDGKIYLSKVSSASITIARFDNPNGYGTAAETGFNQDALRLQTGTNQDRGLTNVNQSIFNSLNPLIDYANLCENDSVAFMANATCQGVIATYDWNFGDPESGVRNTSQAQTPNHRFTRPGTYRVVVLINSGNIFDSAVADITITARAVGRMLGGTVACRRPTDYSLEQDTVAVRVPLSGYDWVVNGRVDTSTFTYPAPNAINIPWDTNQTATVTGYFVTRTTLGELCYSNPLVRTVRVNQQKSATPVGPDTLCQNSAAQIRFTSSDSPRSNFRWLVTPTAGVTVTPAGQGSININFATPGRRVVRVDALLDTAVGICYTQSDQAVIYLAVPPANEISIFGDSSTCEDTQITYRLTAGSAGSRYVWSTEGFESNNQPTLEPSTSNSGQTNTVTFKPEAMGEGVSRYFLTAREVSRDGCEGPLARHAVFQSCTGVPNIITPNGDGVNDEFIIPNTGLYTDNTLQLFTSWGNAVYDQSGYNGEVDTKKLPPGVFFYRYRVNVEGVEKVYSGWIEVIK